LTHACVISRKKEKRRIASSDRLASALSTCWCGNVVAIVAVVERPSMSMYAVSGSLVREPHGKRHITKLRTGALPAANCRSAYSYADVVPSAPSLRRAQAERASRVAFAHWCSRLKSAPRDRTGEYRFGLRCGGIFKFSLGGGRVGEAEGEEERHTTYTPCIPDHVAREATSFAKILGCRCQFGLAIRFAPNPSPDPRHDPDSRFFWPILLVILLHNVWTSALFSSLASFRNFMIET